MVLKIIDITKVNFCSSELNRIALLTAKCITEPKDTSFGLEIKTHSETKRCVVGRRLQGLICYKCPIEENIKERVATQ